MVGPIVVLHKWLLSLTRMTIKLVMLRLVTYFVRQTKYYTTLKDERKHQVSRCKSTHTLVLWRSCTYRENFGAGKRLVSEVARQKSLGLP